MLCGLRAAPPASRSRVANPTRQSVLSGLCCPLTHFYFLTSSFFLWLMQMPEPQPWVPLYLSLSAGASLGCVFPWQQQIVRCTRRWPQQVTASTAACVSTAVSSYCAHLCIRPFFSTELEKTLRGHSVHLLPSAGSLITNPFLTDVCHVCS